MEPEEPLLDYETFDANLLAREAKRAGCWSTIALFLFLPLWLGFTSIVPVAFREGITAGLSTAAMWLLFTIAGVSAVRWMVKSYQPRYFVQGTAFGFAAFGILVVIALIVIIIGGLVATGLSGFISI